MKNQALFSSKDKSNKLKCRLLQFMFGALRVNLLSAQKADDKIFTSAKLKKKFCPKCIILIIQRQKGKKCRSR